MSTEEVVNTSPTQDPKDQDKKSQDSTSTSSSSNSQENQELLNHPYVQDLTLKIDVLKRGILKERKINQELTDKLKKFESELTSKIIKLEEELVCKTSQVKVLIQEKMDLEKQIKTLKKKKKGTGFLDILNIGLDYSDKIQNRLDNPNKTKEQLEKEQQSVEEVSSLANAEMRKLHEKISELQFQNETYFKKMNQTLEDAENKRLQHQNEIQSYMDKISSLEKEIKKVQTEKQEEIKKVQIEKQEEIKKVLTQKQEEIKKIQTEKQELNKKMGTVISMSSESMKEMDHLRSLLNDYKRDREQANISLNSYIEKNNKLIQENKSYKEAILRHEEDSGKMAQKLAELKNLMIKINLKNKMFHVKKVGLLSYTEIDILFGKSEEGNYIMRIDDQNEREIINILDVESVEIQNGTTDKVEIVYMKNGKKLSLVVMVDELIIDQIVKAYKIFFSESMKKLNEIDY